MRNWAPWKNYTVPSKAGRKLWGDRVEGSRVPNPVSVGMPPGRNLSVAPRARYQLPGAPRNKPAGPLRRLKGSHGVLSAPGGARLGAPSPGRMPSLSAAAAGCTRIFSSRNGAEP